MGCGSNATQGTGAGGASAEAGRSGAAGAIGAGQAGSAVGGGGTSASMGGAAGSSGAGGIGVGGASGASGSSSGVAGQAGGQAGGASGGTAGTGGGTAGASAGTAGAGGAGDQPSCLPDGSGSITMTLSGSLTFNETRGNDYACLGHFSNAVSSAGLILRVDNPEPQPYGVVFVDLPKLAPGDLGNIPFDMLTFALTPGGLWSDPNGSTPNTKRCTLNVTANQALAGMPGNYRVAGAITCSSALPGLPAAETVQKLQFVTLVSPLQ